MATYNGERFLREQLQSIVRQTLSPYELVVTDDDSNDRPPEIVAGFANAASEISSLWNRSQIPV
jgi:rhamnosyltransferase